MRVAILNPSFGDNFVRVARWSAKSRGRVQRHPYLDAHMAVHLALSEGDLTPVRCK